MGTTGSIRTRVLLAGIVIVVSIAAVLAWRSDLFQRQVFPKRYWSQQVVELENFLRTQEFLIKDFRFELAKKTLTAKIEVAQQVNIAAELGIDSKEAAKETADKVKADINSLRDLIKISQDDRNKIRAELDLARNELAKHR